MIKTIKTDSGTDHSIADMGPSEEFKELKTHTLPRDRTAQAYLGHWGGNATIAKSRRRIDWLVSCIEGPRVLDIGCSEDILELLAARKEIEVTGVDINGDAISYGRDLLRKESAETQARVRFLVSEYAAMTFDGAQFDSVILGEILDHLSDPQDLISHATKHLKPGGVLALTTRLGSFPHEDHGQTIVLRDLRDWIGSRYEPAELAVVDGYIRFCGRKLRQAEIDPWKDCRSPRLLKITEQAAVESRKDLRQLLKATRASLATLRDTEFPKLKKQLNSTEDRQHLLTKERYVPRKIFQRSMKWHTGWLILLADSILHCSFANRLRRRMAKNGAVLPPSFKRAHQRHSISKQETEASRLRSKNLLLRLRHPSYRKWYFSDRILRIEPFLPASFAERMKRRRDKNAYVVNIASKQLAKSQAGPFTPYFPPIYKPDLPRRTNIRVACILDEFSFRCFAAECVLLPVPRTGWREMLESEKPDFVLLESAWRGSGGKWQYAMSEFGTNTAGAELREFIEHCKRRNLKVVFWNKEDPPNFDHFIEVASLCDVIFTTDEECISRYREKCGHDDVHVLQFAAQPAIHNPVRGPEQPLRDICFAGSWYNRKHADRSASLPVLLDAASSYKLDIFDRNYTRGEESFRFPDKYHSFIRGSLPYEDMLSAYRSYRVFLNVDSVQRSPTMFSRRVFELLACSTPVISTPSEGISRSFEDIVQQADSREAAATALATLLEAPVQAMRLAHQGYRKVMQEHTYAHRFQKICSTLGIDVQSQDEPVVNWFFFVKTSNEVERINRFVGSQTYKNLVATFIYLDGNDNILKYTLASKENNILENCKEKGKKNYIIPWILRRHHGDYALVTLQNGYFAENFVSDMILPFSYTDADAVTKGSYFTLDEHSKINLHHDKNIHRFVSSASLATAIKKDCLQKFSISDRIVKPSSRVRIYSPDPFNAVFGPSRKYPFDLNNHDWAV